MAVRHSVLRITRIIKSHLKATVHGCVQGVYFRAFVEVAAAALGLTGYVRNMADGGVEFEAEGDKTRLEKLVERVKMGPSRARVDSVDVEWSDFAGQFLEFEIRY